MLYNYYLYDPKYKCFPMRNVAKGIFLVNFDDKVNKDLAFHGLYKSATHFKQRSVTGAETIIIVYAIVMRPIKHNQMK